MSMKTYTRFGHCADFFGSSAALPLYSLIISVLFIIPFSLSAQKPINFSLKSAPQSYADTKSNMVAESEVNVSDATESGLTARYIVSISFSVTNKNNNDTWREGQMFLSLADSKRLIKFCDKFMELEKDAKEKNVKNCFYVMGDILKILRKRTPEELEKAKENPQNEYKRKLAVIFSVDSDGDARFQICKYLAENKIAKASAFGVSLRKECVILLKKNLQKQVPELVAKLKKNREKYNSLSLSPPDTTPAYVENTGKPDKKK